MTGLSRGHVDDEAEFGLLARRMPDSFIDRIGADPLNIRGDIAGGAIVHRLMCLSDTVRVDGQLTFNKILPGFQAALNSPCLAYVPENVSRAYVEHDNLSDVLVAWSLKSESLWTTWVITENCSRRNRRRSCRRRCTAPRPSRYSTDLLAHLQASEPLMQGGAPLAISEMTERRN